MQPEVDDPGKPRRIIDNDLFGSSARRKRESDGSQPGGPLGRRALLIERLASAPLTKRLRTIGRSRIPASAPGATDR